MNQSTELNHHSHFAPYLTGQKPEMVIAETDQFMAIIEEKPLVEGHCVVFPKRVEDAFLELSVDELAGIMALAKKVGEAIKKAVPCAKIGVAVLGLQVRHAHVHLVPINSADDLNFTRSKLDLSQDSLKKMADLIRSKIVL